VRAADMDAANALAQQLLRSQMPAPPGETGDEHALLDACPACGTPFDGRADACGECGLEFAATAVLCPACGQEGGSDQAACANCGQAFFAGGD